MSPPPAHSVSAKGDDEVVSQRTFPDWGEVPEIVGVAPKDDSSAAGHMGEKPLWGLVMGAKFTLAPSRYHSGDLHGSGVKRAAFSERRRCACSAGDLCPTRGTG